jgi:hypothetical protein
LNQINTIQFDHYFTETKMLGEIDKERTFFWLSFWNRERSERLHREETFECWYNQLICKYGENSKDKEGKKLRCTEAKHTWWFQQIWYLASY